MDIDVPREKCITERLAEWTVSMLDETASKSVHKEKDRNRVSPEF